MSITRLAVALAVSIPMLAAPRAASAQSNDAAHFTEAFRALCVTTLNNFDPLRKYAKDYKLQSFKRDKQSEIDGVQTENFTGWALPLEGRRYILSIDEIPQSQNPSGKIHICALQSAKVTTLAAGYMVRDKFKGYIKEENAGPDQFGVYTESFYVKGYPNVGTFAIILRKNKNGLVGLAGAKPFN